MTQEARFADATPSKAFFIDMLTRDITVADAILDLVDNAVDKAVEIDQVDVSAQLHGETATRFSGRLVEIELSADEFIISDTCGGITLSEAEDTVFLFGNPQERGADFGLSVYGIGMKRAFFKLGSRVDMESRTAHDYWSVSWPIDRWKNQKPWKVPIDHWQSDLKAQEATSTRIRVGELHPAIAQRLAQEPFHRELRSRIASTYALFLSAGLRVTINGDDVTAALPVLALDPVAPARQEWSRDGVDVLLIVGLSPLSDQEPRGWYVFCNGRMVLEADKTQETGWGDTLPQFRSKYNHFVGHLYFKSEDVRKLPWRTTKQGVEREAPVYQHALAEIRVFARPVLTFLNDLYPSDIQVDPSVQRATLQQATSAPITAIPIDIRTFSYAPRRRQPKVDINIQFRRLKADVERIKRHLGDTTLSAGYVGGYAFDFFLEQEVDA